jgi:hypothetical protein
MRRLATLLGTALTTLLASVLLTVAPAAADSHLQDPNESPPDGSCRVACDPPPPTDGDDNNTPPPPPTSDIPVWQQRLSGVQSSLNARLDARRAQVSNPRLSKILDVVQNRLNATFERLLTR